MITIVDKSVTSSATEECSLSEDVFITWPDLLCLVRMAGVVKGAWGSVVKGKGASEKQTEAPGRMVIEFFFVSAPVPTGL